jgi:hypothetical protein
MHRDQPQAEPGENPAPGEEKENTEGGQLERRPDNVGQSGRWKRKDAPSRYGQEESKHSTEQSSDGASGVDHPGRHVE